MKIGAVVAIATALSLALLSATACASHLHAREGVEGAGEGGDLLASRTMSVDAENVRLIGRTCTEGGVTWLAQSGSAIEFEAVGKKVELEIAGDAAVAGDEDRRPRFAVLVDGRVVLDDTLGECSRVVEAFSEDVVTHAVVEVMQLSEASSGVIGVRAIAVESDADKPVTPTAAKDLSVEFIGDSITCAFGVEAAGADEPFKTTTENFMESYAYLTAAALGADCSAVCYSGYGVVSGWTADGSRNEGMLVPPLYGLVSEDHGQPWDFESHVSDVVVINLVANDSSYTGAYESRMQEFARGYEDFLSLVRERNPESCIICTLGTMEGRELYPFLERAVQGFKDRTGDARVMCYLSDRADLENDGVGAVGHPSAITQQKSADALVGVIRQALGCA